jgi:hypothetical protein
MQLKRLLIALSLLLIATAGSGQTPGTIDADILLSYYDQDGDHSPVTGGVGTEKLEVVSPVIVLAWRVSEKLSVTADIGVDQISSASMGNIQMELSSASIPASDTRTFGTFGVKRKFGRQTVGLSLGAAKEYDYRSISYGIDWAMEFNGSNSTISAGLRRYDDAIELIGIDGYGWQGIGRERTAGEGDRTTTDAVVTFSQTLGPRTVGSIELFLSQAEGVLSTPYHEVILAGAVDERVAERLPDSRDREAIGLKLNHGFSDRIVQRVGYRFYSDDWGVTAHTLDLETHFRLPGEREMWLFPILRYHTQEGADYFGEPGTFTGTESFYSSDWDLAETTSNKLGIGWTVATLPRDRLILLMDRFEIRGTYYERDDGLTGFTTSFGFGWTY